MNIICNWASISDKVTTYYNIQGKPDSWGNKWSIFFPPTIALALWLFMGVMNKLGSCKA